MAAQQLSVEKEAVKNTPSKAGFPRLKNPMDIDTRSDSMRVELKSAPNTQRPVSTYWSTWLPVLIQAILLVITALLLLDMKQLVSQKSHRQSTGSDDVTAAVASRIESYIAPNNSVEKTLGTAVSRGGGGVMLADFERPKFVTNLNTYFFVSNDQVSKQNLTMTLLDLTREDRAGRALEITHAHKSLQPGQIIFPLSTINLSDHKMLLVDAKLQTNHDSSEAVRIHIEFYNDLRQRIKRFSFTNTTTRWNRFGFPLTKDDSRSVDSTVSEMRILIEPITRSGESLIVGIDNIQIK